MALPPPAPGLGSRLLSAYLRAVAARPFAVNAATGWVTASIGDVVCQALEGGPFSARRTAEMALVRAGFMAPFLTLYFPLLARSAPGPSFRAVSTRLFLDQAVGAPVTICATFALTAALQGHPETAAQRIREQLLPTWSVSVCYWPIVHSWNFRAVPVMHQPLVAHVASLAWQAFLSYRTNIALKGADGRATADVLLPRETPAAGIA